MMKPKLDGQNSEFALSFANALTSDMAWLVQLTITLPDGSKQAVFVPRSMCACAPAT
jgi:hypothetical protein